MTDFKAKMHQIRFRLGLRPRPRWGSFAPPGQTPVAGFRGRFAAGEGLCWEEEGKGRGRGGRGSKGREKEGPQVSVEPGPEPCYATDCVNDKNKSMTDAQILVNNRLHILRNSGTKQAYNVCLTLERGCPHII